jgi:copper chaperone CopZ
LRLFHLFSIKIIFNRIYTMFSMMCSTITIKLKNGLFGLFCLFLLGSCLKLQEKDLKFDMDCPDCIKIVLDSVYMMKGVHYVDYNGAEKTLKIKYDTANFSMRRLNLFLTEGGYVNVSQDSLAKKPNCCR